MCFLLLLSVCLDLFSFYKIFCNIVLYFIYDDFITIVVVIVTLIIIMYVLFCCCYFGYSV